MIKMYREKSKIDAERFDGSQKSVFGYKIVPDKPFVDAPNEKPKCYFVLTGDNFEDGILIEKGDWILNDGTDIYQLDNESFKNRCDQLPVIPAVIAEYISAVKNGETDLEDSTVVEAALGAIEYDQASYIEADWIQQHGDTFARAWLDGYQVEADK